MKLAVVRRLPLESYLLSVCVAALLFLAPNLAAQSQNSQKESLGEAARKARQQKKPSAKPAKVLTDDDLARLPVTPAPSVQNAKASEARIPGEAPAAGEPGQAPQGESGSTEPGGELEERRAKLDADLKAAKEQLAEAEKELNLLQREFDLRRDQYYSNPDFKSDKQGKAQLDSLQQQINRQQQEVDGLKEKVANLAAERRSLPGPPPAPEKPAAPSPPQA